MKAQILALALLAGFGSIVTTTSMVQAGSGCCGCNSCNSCCGCNSCGCCN